MARISYVERTALPESYRDLLDTHLEVTLPNVDSYETVQERNVAGGSRNIYRLLGHAPEVLRSHREHLTLLWETFDLPARDRELALLALARELRAEDEWHHHIPVAYDEGISLDEIRAIADGEYAGFDDHEVAVMRYAKAFATISADDEHHARVAATYNEHAMLGLATLLGFYVFLAYTLDALGVDLEEPFVGWHLEGL